MPHERGTVLPPVWPRLRPERHQHSSVTMVTTAQPIWTRAHMRSRRCEAEKAVTVLSPVGHQGPVAVAGGAAGAG
jgi:hypothetical protein